MAKFEAGKFYRTDKNKLVEIVCDLVTPCSEYGRYVGKLDNGAGSFFIATFNDMGSPIGERYRFVGALTHEAKPDTYLVRFGDQIVERFDILEVLKKTYTDIYKKV